MTLVLKWRVVEITCMAGQQCLMGTDVSLTRLTADPSPAPRGEEQTCYRWLVCLWSSLLKTRFRLGSNLVEDMKAVVYRQTPGEEDKRSLKKPWSGVSCKKSWRSKKAQQCVLVPKKAFFCVCTAHACWFSLIYAWTFGLRQSVLHSTSDVQWSSRWRSTWARHNKGNNTKP